MQFIVENNNNIYIKYLSLGAVCFQIEVAGSLSGDGVLGSPSSWTSPAPEFLLSSD